MAGESVAAPGPAPSTADAARAPALKVQIYAASANAAFADRVAQALDSEGFSIVTGDFEKSGAEAVIVVWSGTAIGSKRLIEAALAPLRRGALVPVSIGKIEPPDDFKGLSPVDLSNWTGATIDSRWRSVIDAVRRAARAGTEESAPDAAATTVAAPALREGARDFMSWFDHPYTEDDRPKARPAPVAPPSPSRRRKRRASPALLAGFGVVAAVLFAGFAFLQEPAQAPASLAGAPAAEAETAAPPDRVAAAAPEAPMLAEILPLEFPPAGAPPAAPADPPARAAADEIAALIALHGDVGAPPASEEDSGDALAGAAAAPRAASRIKDCAACPELAVIPAGAFIMGARPDAAKRRPEEGPAVEVEIKRPFALARRETSVAEWSACVAAKACPPAPQTGWADADLPVTNISWSDAEAYAKWLSETTGKAYRLPSEAEWEYAARAGARTSFSFGPSLSAGDASFDGALPYGGAAGRTLQRPRPVGSYQENAFGLFDMHGNVWEWTADCWSPSHRGAPRSGDCSVRVIKGGAWNSGGWRLRAEHRIGKSAAAREYDNGFRVARDLP